MDVRLFIIIFFMDVRLFIIIVFMDVRLFIINIKMLANKVPIIKTCYLLMKAHETRLYSALHNN